MIFAFPARNAVQKPTTRARYSAKSNFQPIHSSLANLKSAKSTTSRLNADVKNSNFIFPSPLPEAVISVSGRIFSQLNDNLPSASAGKSSGKVGLFGENCSPNYKLIYR